MLAYNLRRPFNILGMARLMAALTAGKRGKTPRIAPDRAARPASGRSRKPGKVRSRFWQEMANASHLHRRATRDL